MVKIASRTPDNYSIGVPQVLFNPVPSHGNFARWIDCFALANAALGITNDSGQVVNSFGNPVGTPGTVVSETYLGCIDSGNLGGDIETLDHTVNNMGYLEMDRSIVLNRPYQYSLTFDEPDIKNLARFLVAEETNFGNPIKALWFADKIFAGSLTPALTIFDRACGDPDKAVEQVMTRWSLANAPGVPPNGLYGFIIGGTNEEECVGEWKNKRHWIAYAEIDFTVDEPEKQKLTWQYLRPHGTSIGGVYGDQQLVDINNTCLSVPDSEPIVTFCGDTPQWNARAVLAWTGYGWYGAEEGFFGYTVVGAAQSFKRCLGCACLILPTEIGLSRFHVIPRCTLAADGTMDFSADQWQQGTFTLAVQRDSSAKFIDRKPAQPIPFGFLQVIELLPRG